METVWPRNAESSSSFIASTSRPSTFKVPEICVRFFGNSRISARRVTLLPEPDSPSRPSTSPSPSVSEMSLTA